MHQLRSLSLRSGLIMTMPQFVWIFMCVLQEFDGRAGGFTSMLYWLEVQDMALQAAGGKPGPEAEAAVKKLIASLPHSVVLARFVVFVTVLIANQCPEGQSVTAG